MPEQEQIEPSGQDFKATEIDLGTTADQAAGAAPEQPRTERERQIDRRFFEEQRAEMQKELDHITAMLEMNKQALEKAWATDAEDGLQQPDYIKFVEQQIKSWEETQKVAQASLDRAEAGLAQLDA